MWSVDFQFSEGSLNAKHFILCSWPAATQSLVRHPLFFAQYFLPFGHDLVEPVFFEKNEDVGFESDRIRCREFNKNNY